MKSRYLLGAGAALAMALIGAEANAQFAWMGGPYPITYYVGPEGGWTSLPNQRVTNTTSVPFRVDTVGGASNGPFFSSFGTGSARYDSGFNAGARAGLQWGPVRLEEEYSYRHNGLSQFTSFYNTIGVGNNLFTGNRNTNSIMTNAILYNILAYFLFFFLYFVEIALTLFFAFLLYSFNHNIKTFHFLTGSSYD